MDGYSSISDSFSPERRSEELEGLPDYSDAVDVDMLAVGQFATQPSSPQSQIQRTPGLRPDTEHISTLEDGAGRPWISLTVKSRSPSSNMAPLVYEDQPICGNVTLDLAKPQSIEEVSVSVGAVCNQTQAILTRKISRSMDLSSAAYPRLSPSIPRPKCCGGDLKPKRQHLDGG